MERRNLEQAPGFLVGSEVARTPVPAHPTHEEQLSLLDQEADFKKKLLVALGVVLAVLLAGMVVGAVLGYFI